MKQEVLRLLTHTSVMEKRSSQERLLRELLFSVCIVKMLDKQIVFNGGVSALHKRIHF